MREKSIQALLSLEMPPISVGFFDSPPPGVTRWQGHAKPAGCAFWREAQTGRAFYTVPEDHYNCAVGAYTHAIPLPVARAEELEQTVGFMVKADYLRLEEVPNIPALKATPAIIAYAPVERDAFPAHAVIVAARPAQAMLLYEAALAAGTGAALMSALGRPGCAILPLAADRGAAISFGCAGNRTHTGLPDDQLYVCIPGDQWSAVTEKVAAVVAANRIMDAHYHSKQETLAAA